MKLLIFFYFFSIFLFLLMGVDYLSYKIVFFIQVLSLFLIFYFLDIIKINILIAPNLLFILFYIFALIKNNFDLSIFNKLSIAFLSFLIFSSIINFKKINIVNHQNNFNNKLNFKKISLYLIIYLVILFYISDQYFDMHRYSVNGIDPNMSALLSLIVLFLLCKDFVSSKYFIFTVFLVGILIVYLQEVDQVY